MTTTVFISGATGFIAQHTIKQLLAKGYTVVGSVRTAAKGDNLKKNLASDKFSYEIVADLESEGAFEKALKNHPEATIFLHTASPVTFEADDFEKDIILPAINGTKNVLAAIKGAAPQIKRVVLTSSVAAQLSNSDPLAIVDETSWNDISYEVAKLNGWAAYVGSKTFAEKAAWEFVEKEKPNFTLTTINPVYVFGPQAFDLEAKGGVNASNTFISSLLKLKEGDELPSHAGDFIDVRDTAAAHIIAFEKKGAEGERISTASELFNSQTLLNIINENFPSLNLSKGDPSNGNSKSEINDKKSREFLQIKYKGLKESVVETVKQYLEQNK